MVTINGKALSLAEAQRAVRRSATWFWWLGGLSLINSVATAMDLKYRMILGLGFTQALDGLFAPEEAIHLVLVLALVGLFFLFGYYARGLSMSWYGSGMLIYGVDTLIFVVARDWIAVGFHVFVLFMLWGGFLTLRGLKQQTGHPTDAPA